MLLSLTVNDPVGVSTDPAGDIFISYDSSNSSAGQRETIEEEPSGGGAPQVLYSHSGGAAHPGALVTLGATDSLPNLPSGDVLELQPNGDLFAVSPATSTGSAYDFLQHDSTDSSNVFDTQTSSYANLDNTISLSSATFGDLDASGNNLLVAGQSSGWDFVMRVSYTANGSGGVNESLKTLVAAPASDGLTQPGGVAVNGQQSALAILPTAAGSDVPVAFNLFFDQGQTPAPEVLTLGLPSQPTIQSFGASAASDGSFVVAAATSSLLNGSPGYVTISADLSRYSAEITATDSSTNLPYVPYDVAVIPTASGGGLAATDPTDNYVLAGTSNYNPPSTGYSPAQIKHAYGVDQITFTTPAGTTIAGDGSGQTIALVEEGYDPTIESDLTVYSTEYGLPLPGHGFTFTQLSQTGMNTFGPITPGNLPPVYATSAIETALDVETAHAIAPGANILVVETNSQYPGGLDAAESYAASQPGVSAVSISYGNPEFIVNENGTDDEAETNHDKVYQVQHVTFVAASGDEGDTPDYHNNADTTISVGYPSASPDVVTVGGTNLPLDAAGDYPGTTGPNAEVGWETGPHTGAGGGLSTVEPEPSWQQGVVPSSLDSQDARAVPDVAWDAAGATGLNVFSATFGGKDTTGGWVLGDGTSVAAPEWAALIAIVNQGRVLEGGLPLTGYDQTLPGLYSVYSLHPSDFHDIVSVVNPNTASLQAAPGYDFVTGLGTPVANLLVPDLVAYDLASKLVVTTLPAATVTAGSEFQLSVTIEDTYGNPVADDGASVTVSLGQSPGGSSLGGTANVSAVGGVVTFSNLTLNKAGAVTLNLASGSLTPATSGTITVSAAAANHLVIATQPPGTVNPGTPFGLRALAEDPYGNVNPTFSGLVNVALFANPGGATLNGAPGTMAQSGVAIFSGLSLARPGTGYILQVSSGGLTPATTNAFNVPMPPTLKLVKFTVIPTISVTFQFSTAMNPATAGLGSNYQAYALSTKIVKRKRLTIAIPVPIKAVYSQSRNSITLTVVGKNPFTALGGQIKILASSPKTGVSSASGVLLNPTYTLITIRPQGVGIILG
ncbi:MAG: hypothetical protein ACLQIB_38090 [Isosphaeraceae bacterium]